MKIVLIAVCSLVIALHGVSASVELGIDVLQKQGFAILQGKRVGLVTNQTGVNSSGTKTRAILRNAPGVKPSPFARRSKEACPCQGSWPVGMQVCRASRPSADGF